MLIIISYYFSINVCNFDKVLVKFLTSKVDKNTQILDHSNYQDNNKDMESKTKTKDSYFRVQIIWEQNEIEKTLILTNVHSKPNYF